MDSLSVKDWFANKIANEIRQNITMCDVFCILKETEKAVYAMLNLGTDNRRTMWIPKSVLVPFPVGTDANGRMHYETLRIDNYDEAVKRFDAHWNDFK